MSDKRPEFLNCIMTPDIISETRSKQDIWEYLKKYEVSYSPIYDMGYERTGCMWCMFGVHLEKGENRFQRMKKSHPNQWNYCINKLGLGQILDFINVPYE